ncbi:MAG: MarR family winged helix-turn-helix transcriptional regulator [Alphaproteobacteria bacterium]
MQQGISSGQWRFLRVLWQEDGISQRELSRRVDMREPTTVVALKGLEKKGLVIRNRDDVDRRKIRVFLTDEARALHNQLMPYVAEVNALANAGVSNKDLETAKRVLLTMSRNLSPDLAGRSSDPSGSA